MGNLILASSGHATSYWPVTSGEQPGTPNVMRPRAGQRDLGTVPTIVRPRASAPRRWEP